MCKCNGNCTHGVITVGSIVIHKGRKYLVDEISHTRNSYELSVIGHKSLDSEGYGEAWVDFKDVKWVADPSLESMRMIRGALEDREWEE